MVANPGDRNCDPGIADFRRARQGQNKNIENNPMQSKNLPRNLISRWLAEDLDQQHPGIPDRAHERDDDTGGQPMQPLAGA
jgi:hypothetical protein